MKKKFMVPLAVAFMALGLAACGEETPTPTPEPAHTHSYVKEVVKENYLKDAATCTTPASYYKSCECGEKGTETFASGEALGHTAVTDAAVAATCTTAGKTEGSHCSVCNEVLTAQTDVAALGHTEVTDAAVAATCTTAGKTEGKHCSVCDTVTVAQTDVAALGHTEVTDAGYAATCTTAGKTDGKHCSVCDTVTVAQTDIAALGHTEVTDAAVAATCTADGLTEGKHCSVCNTVTVAQETVAATGHTEVTDEAVAATCVADGLTEGKHCSTCNTVTVAQEVVPATGVHQMEKGECVNEGCVYKDYTSFTIFADGNGALLWYEKDGADDTWTSGTNGTSSREYSYVIDRVRGGDKDVKIDPNLFEVSAKTAPSLNGKWANFSSDSDSISGKEICLFGKEGETSSMTFTSTQEIYSVVVTYVSATNAGRAAFYAGEAAVEGTSTDNKTYTYTVNGNSFTIENTGYDYLYMYAIRINYEAPQVYDTNTEIDLLAHTDKVEGAKAEWNGLYIDATTGKWQNNNGGWIQYNNGTKVSLRVADGAEVTPVTYQGSTSYEVTYANGYATITATDNIYIKAINVAYPKVYDTNTTIDLAAFDGHYEGNAGKWNGLSIDATTGKFADNGNWVQVNTGTVIKFNVAEGAQVALTTYQDATDYEVTVADGVATINVTGNIYIGSIAVSYPGAGETAAKLSQKLDIDALYAELFPNGEKRGVENVSDKILVPTDSMAFDWVEIEGVQLRTGDADNKLEINKNETGHISYTVTGKVVITVQVASTSKTNSSSFALKVGDAYVACNEDATAISSTVVSKTITPADESTVETGKLYELTGTDNVYLIYGSGDGITVTYTIDATNVEGGIEVSLVSPDAGFGRGTRLLSFTVEEAE